ncbi:MAG: hypothetical protein ACLPXM_11560 [Terriglobales bacterium]
MDIQEQSRSLWATRRSAEQALEGPLSAHANLLTEAFAWFDVCTDRIARTDTQFGRVCALVVIKARNLALGCYSLALDALAQEAGALFRPLIESLELLEYLRQDPSRIAEAVESRLPPAGIIAQRIEGKFKDLRKYLNEHASHLSLSPEAMGHLVSLKDGQLRTAQPYNERVLRQNLKVLLAVVVAVARVAVTCVSVAQGEVQEALAADVNDLSQRTYGLIDQDQSSE